MPPEEKVELFLANVAVLGLLVRDPLQILLVPLRSFLSGVDHLLARIVYQLVGVVC